MAKYNAEILTYGVVVDVAHVQCYLVGHYLFDICLIGVGSLTEDAVLVDIFYRSPIGDARTHAQYSLLFRCIEACVFLNFRTWSYETVTVQAAYDEPVYESVVICGGCGKNFGSGAAVFHEKNLKAKFVDLAFVLLGMIFLYLGSR